jgi:hypothetical protein
VDGRPRLRDGLIPRDFLDEIEMELDAARRNSTRLAGR